VKQHIGSYSSAMTGTTIWQAWLGAWTWRKLSW